MLTDWQAEDIIRVGQAESIADYISDKGWGVLTRWLT